MNQTEKRILIVDDDKSMRNLLKALLSDRYDLAEAEDGEQALALSREFDPDLVLLDIIMPGIDGYETCRRLKLAGSIDRPHILMVSAKSTRIEQAKAFEVGADDYMIKPVDPHELRSRIQLHFRLRNALDDVVAVRAEIEERHSEIKQLSEQRRQDITAMQDIAVFTLAKVAESRDQETGEHLVRMRAYSQILAEELQRDSPYSNQIDDPFLEDLYRSSPLHDIGKVGICDAILLKPGRYTADEFEMMKQHTIIGTNILDDAVWHEGRGGFLAMASVIARFHHERFDGSGYLAGLVGYEIPLPARIVAVADVYDALTSERPYKKPFASERSRKMILRDSGSHFDPVIVDAFQRRFDKFREIQAKFVSREINVRGAMSFQSLSQYEELVSDLRS